uniref:Uncharacterized protein n=1 Tax=Anguilla anguilla TaxID=7936 RepID=A0A0E9XUM0_ANGAN
MECYKHSLECSQFVVDFVALAFSSLHLTQ